MICISFLKKKKYTSPESIIHSASTSVYTKRDGLPSTDMKTCVQTWDGSLWVHREPRQLD